MEIQTPPPAPFADEDWLSDENVRHQLALIDLILFAQQDTKVYPS